MVLPSIQMETIFRLTGKILKASQGGLTTPTLYDSGLDFSNRGRKTRKRRHVRISCINVTYGLSSVVFISHPNQLYICHTSRFVESQVLQKCSRESLQKCHCCKNVCQVWQKCFTESVARMSLWQECHTSRFVESQEFFHELQHIRLLEYKRILMQEITYIRETECVESLRFRTNRTPPMEKLPPPMEKLRPLGGNR